MTASVEIRSGIRIDKNPDPVEVMNLYREAGWLSPDDDPETIRRSLAGSYAFCGAWEGGRLIGMMRAISDGVSDAYMLDLVVLKEFRKKGIGKCIAEHLAKYLKSLGIEWIVCIGAPGTEKFYASTDAKNMKGFFPLRFYESEETKC